MVKHVQYLERDHMRGVIRLHLDQHSLLLQPLQLLFASLTSAVKANNGA